MKATLKKIIAAPFVILAAIIVLLEDWLWDDLLRLAAALGKLPLLRQLEIFIAQLPPYAALTTFALPSLLLLPIKLAAVWLLSHGQPTLGFATVIGAKVVGTALVARIYALTQQQLLSIRWFAILHQHFTRFKQQVYAVIKATTIYQSIVRLKTKIRLYLQQQSRAFWKKRWQAAVRFSKRARISKSKPERSN